MICARRATDSFPKLLVTTSPILIFMVRQQLESCSSRRVDPENVFKFVITSTLTVLNFHVPSVRQRFLPFNGHSDISHSDFR